MNKEKIEELKALEKKMEKVSNSNNTGSLDKVCFGLIGILLFFVKMVLFLWLLPFAFFFSMCGLGLFDILNGKYK